MLIWLVSAFAFTFALGAYLSRKGFDRHEQYQGIGAALLATGCGAIGIYIARDLPSRQIITESSTPAFSKVAVEPDAHPIPNLDVSMEKIAEKPVVPEPVLKWAKLKEKNYDIQNQKVFSLSSTSKLANYSGEFLNKYNKTVIGIEAVITVRNCGRVGGDRKSCPIESGPHLRKMTEVVIQPHQSTSIGTTVAIIGKPEYHVLDVDLKRVVYFDGDWFKDKELTASNDFNSLYNIAASDVDLTPTCGAGHNINTAPSRTKDVRDAGLFDKPAVRHC
jgi:hypothetical protein